MKSLPVGDEFCKTRNGAAQLGLPRPLAPAGCPRTRQAHAGSAARMSPAHQRRRSTENDSTSIVQSVAGSGVIVIVSIPEFS